MAGGKQTKILCVSCARVLRVSVSVSECASAVNEREREINAEREREINTDKQTDRKREKNRHKLAWLGGNKRKSVCELCASVESECECD